MTLERRQAGITQAPRGMTPMAPAAEGGTRFRSDIQGLRAVAVLLVVLAHAHIPRMSGGFVGVDVFFVISGFVITGALMARSGSAMGDALLNFYAARARRILPMSTVVLVATVVASTLWLNFVRVGHIVTDALWATAFAANFRFWSVGTDYFATTQPPSPLQHYWSLGVEEQFYVVWPLLFLWLSRGGSRPRAVPRAVNANLLTTVLLVLGLASFVWSLHETPSSPTAAYFSPVTRGWELALGAIVAMLAGSIGRVPLLLRQMAACAGLLGVLVSATVYSGATPWPGRAALLPVLSATAIIAGGISVEAGIAQRALSIRPLRIIGDWSYSLYLWHWPILIIAEQHAGHRLSMQRNLLLIALAIALSGITYHAVEQPFRVARPLRRRPIVSMSLWPVAATLIVVACVGATARAHAEEGDASHGGRSAAVSAMPADPAAAVAAAVLAVRRDAALPGTLVPAPGGAAAQVDSFRGICTYPSGNRSWPVCRYGDQTSKRVDVVIGDSHAGMWGPAFDAIGVRYHWGFYSIVRNSCSPIAITTPSDIHGCSSWRDWALREVGVLHPDRIVVATDTRAVLSDGRGQPLTNPAASDMAWRAATTQTITRLEGEAREVDVLSNPPGLSTDPVDCLLRPGAGMRSCAAGLQQLSPDINASIRAGTLAAHGIFVDLTPWFCSQGVCPAVIGNYLPYGDISHITRPYASYLSTALAVQLGF